MSVCSFVGSAAPSLRSWRSRASLASYASMQSRVSCPRVSFNTLVGGSSSPATFFPRVQVAEPQSNGVPGFFEDPEPVVVRAPASIDTDENDLSDNKQAGAEAIMRITAIRYMNTIRCGRFQTQLGILSASPKPSDHAKVENWLSSLQPEHEVQDYFNKRACRQVSQNPMTADSISKANLLTPNRSPAEAANTSDSMIAVGSSKASIEGRGCHQGGSGDVFTVENQDQCPLVLQQVLNRTMDRVKRRLDTLLPPGLTNGHSLPQAAPEHSIWSISQCLCCNQSFPSGDDLEQHLLESQPEHAKKHEATMCLTCKICGKFSPSPFLHIYHIRVVHVNNSGQCPLCDYSTNRKYHLTSHILNMHTDTPPQSLYETVPVQKADTGDQNGHTSEGKAKVDSQTGPQYECARSRQDPGRSNGKSRKRPRSLGRRDNSSGDDNLSDDERRPKRQKTAQDQDCLTAERRLACPYYKRRPVEYMRIHPGSACVGRGFELINHLKYV